MLGSAILEMAIGLVLLFVLVSTLCMVIREALETWLKTRAAYLEQGIRELLSGAESEGLVAALFMHPLIAGLYLGDYSRPKSSTPDSSDGAEPSALMRGRNMPSYIPAKSFALALMDIAARRRTIKGEPELRHSPISESAIRANVSHLGCAPVQRMILMALDAAHGDLEAAQKSIEAWFDSAMERVSGRYRRATHKLNLGIAILLAVMLNIDTLSVAQFLYQNETARDAIVAKAETAATDTAFLSANSEQVRNELAALKLPIGWESEQLPRDYAWLSKALGWLVTALAATLGAPFWFDVLNKFVVIRSTVKPHEKSGEEASKDRQETPAPSAPRRTAVGMQRASAGSAQTDLDDDSASPDALSIDDACDIAKDEDETPDDELPIARGGVA